MSIQERKYTKKDGKVSKWYYASVWNPATKKPVLGKMREKRKEAVQDEARIITEVEKGKHNLMKQKSFGTVADMWLKAAVGQLAVCTHKVYKADYNRYIKGRFSQKDFNRITSVQIQQFVNDMNKKYSPETVNKSINILCNIFNFGINTLKLLPANENPMIGIKRSKVPYKKKVTWTDQQVSMFLCNEIVRDDYYYPMYCNSLMLGMRPGEVCGIAEDDLSIEKHEFNLNRAYNKFGVLSDMKNSGSRRSVYIPELLYKINEKQLLWKRKMKSYHPDFDNDFLFVTVTGCPVNPNYYSKNFQKTIKNYNDSVPEDQKLPVIPLYNLRHTFATNNYERGESDKVLSEIMGNKPKTFLQTYAHIRRSQKASALTDYENEIFKDFNKEL